MNGSSQLFSHLMNALRKSWCIS